ncbi:MAG: DUF6183 family protein [Planctomycetota bacterium]
MTNASPTVPETLQMFRELECQRLPSVSEAESAFVEALGTCYANGEVRYASFHVAPHPVFDLLEERGRLVESGFMHHVWSLPAVAEVFRCAPREGALPYARSAFGNLTALDLDGFLARTLHEGGAYESTAAPVAQSLARACADAMVDGRLDGANVFATNEPWCDFFYDVAWDVTLVTFVPQTRRLRVLIATDTD